MGAGLIGITLIQDLMRAELHCNFLTHMQVVLAIPQSLIDRAEVKLINKYTFFQRVSSN